MQCCPKRKSYDQIMKNSAADVRGEAYGQPEEMHQLQQKESDQRGGGVRERRMKRRWKERRTKRCGYLVDHEFAGSAKENGLFAGCQPSQFRLVGEEVWMEPGEAEHTRPEPAVAVSSGQSRTKLRRARRWASTCWTCRLRRRRSSWGCQWGTDPP